MATFNPDKVRSEFDKLPLGEQISEYHKLGEWLHEKIVAQQEAAKALEEQLKQKQ